MKAKMLLFELKNYMDARNCGLSRTDAEFNLSQGIPKWRSYSAEQKQNHIDNLYKEIQAANVTKLNGIIAKIQWSSMTEKQNIDAVKFPLRSSKDPGAKALGTAQQTNALLFLNGGPSVERIALEMRNALSRGEVDYAFTIEENCSNKFGEGYPALQDRLKTEVYSALMSFGEWEKIETSAYEMATYAAAGKIAADIMTQEERGKETIASAELERLIAEPTHATDFK